MKNEQMSKSVTGENLEEGKATHNSEKENINNTEVSLDEINKEIAKKQDSINNMMDNISELRKQLGLAETLEIPPSVQQAQETMEKLKNKVEYFNEIPIEKGKYYRVTGMSEILSIVKNKSLSLPAGSFYDRKILNQISKKSGYSIEELELINAEDSTKIKEIYNKYIHNPNNEKGITTIVARTKSNHGDIGFVKEGFFYNPINKDSGHFGAPVIVGREDTSLFQKGAHGSRQNLFNKEIESNKAVVLKEGTDARNFDYWLHEKDKGWYKNSFEDLQARFENK